MFSINFLLGRKLSKNIIRLTLPYRSPQNQPIDHSFHLSLLLYQTPIQPQIIQIQVSALHPQLFA